MFATLSCLFLQSRPAFFTKKTAFMNRREAIMAGTAGFAAVLSGAPAASAQTSETENPELQPIRDLLDAHDAAFANHDLDGVMACLSEKATIMGTSPGEIWSGPDEIKEAHQHLFEGFDFGEQNFEYEFSIGEITSDKESLDRRLFLRSMGKWSGAAIAAVGFGGAWLASAPEAEAGIWINRWGPRRGGWRGPRRGRWINSWGPRRGRWVNRW
jgi:SnoaL-like domain